MAIEYNSSWFKSRPTADMIRNAYSFSFVENIKSKIQKGIQYVASIFDKAQEQIVAIKTEAQRTVGVINFENGDIYEGQILNQQPNGKGNMTYADGRIVYGEWEGLDPVGTCTCMWRNGDKYVGTMKDGQMHGKGQLTRVDGLEYDGEWENGLKHGVGILISDELTYNGQFANDNFNGKGEVKYTNGDKYVGQFANGTKHGKGDYTWKNGEKFSGDWLDDVISGEGVFIFSNGDKYDGQWMNGKKEGHGVMKFDNKEYDGDWKNDMKNGQGRLKYSKDIVFSGVWVDDKIEGPGKLSKGNTKYTGVWSTAHGSVKFSNGDEYAGEGYETCNFGIRGKYIYANGDIYEGNWRNNLWNGKGKLTNKSGDIFDAQWQDGVMHGFCVCKYANGDSYKGNMVSGNISGKGEYIWNNGDKYNGEWTDNEQHGEGIMKLSDGTKYVGQWASGVRSGYGVLFKTNGEISEKGDWKDDKLFISDRIRSFFIFWGYLENLVIPGLICYLYDWSWWSYIVAYVAMSICINSLVIETLFLSLEYFLITNILMSNADSGIKLFVCILSSVFILLLRFLYVNERVFKNSTDPKVYDKDEDNEKLIKEIGQKYRV